LYFDKTNEMILLHNQ